ncbi:ribokinase [Actinotalea ferrariae]|uniref:ribokinase n=1 Tax=Actinotalea ferrariae TaxID=1386098 RepID=UPI001C8BC865|nr:ribokinase [Actinotalea ferrariae]MBX9244402.1 ribokinase [Actinotalea ferrariae]
MSAKHVIVVGSANVDLVVAVPRHPAGGETVLGGDLVRSPGGKGANQAVSAARTGGVRTTFVAAVGRDDAGDLLLEALEGAGVRTGAVVRIGAPTGTALIMVDPSGENAIVVAPGANALLQVRGEAAAAVAGGDVVLAQLEVPLEAVLDAARARRPGSLMVLNAAPSRPLPDELWGMLDVLVVNEHEARGMVGDLGATAERASAEDLAARLLQAVPAVVVTLGAAGCLVAERGTDAHRIPAPRVEVVDTTGAGDAFCGVLAAGLAEGSDLTTAAWRAVLAAARVVTRHGAQDAVPARDELDAAQQT